MYKCEKNLYYSILYYHYVACFNSHFLSWYIVGICDFRSAYYNRIFRYSTKKANNKKELPNNRPTQISA